MIVSYIPLIEVLLQFDRKRDAWNGAAAHTGKVGNMCKAILSLILTFGLAVGAISWISNQINIGVTVSDWEILLSDPQPGSFTDMKVGTMSSGYFTYTINDPENSIGYLWIEFDGTGDEALSDVSVNFVEVTDSDGVSDYLQIITGYPNLDNSIDYYFGATSSTPYDFSTRTATGDVTLTLRVTPNSPLISQIKLIVTSGLP